METTPHLTLDRTTIQLLEIGIKELLEKEIGMLIRIPNQLAIAMNTEFKKFKETNYPEILHFYTFGVESQKLFLDQINNSKNKIVTLHLALTDKNFNEKHVLINENSNPQSANPQLQYIFEFDKNGKYFIYFNNNPKNVDDTIVCLEDLKRCTEAYKNSSLSQNLDVYIKNKTGNLLQENTKRINIEDIAANTNEIYNEIVRNYHSGLKPFYVYPVIQLLDFSINSTVNQLIRSASQLYTFGIVMSTELDMTSKTAIVDDRHYHCPPNLC